MFRKLLLSVICLGFFLGLSGCWDKREIDTDAIPVAIGVDLKDQKIKISALFTRPRPSGESESSQATQALSASDRGVSMAARRIMLSMSLFPEWPHIRTFVLGENLATHDLSPVMDFITRNRNIRPDMNLMVCRDCEPEMLFTEIGSLGSGELRELVYFGELETGIYTPIDLGEFAYRLTTPGIEPAVPLVMLKKETSKRPPPEKLDKNEMPTNNKQERIVLQGTGVFKGKKMVGILNEQESRGYRWLSSRQKLGGLFRLNSPLNPDILVALEIARFSSKTRPVLKDGELRMQIAINANLAFYESNGEGELLTLDMLNILEQAAGAEIEKQISSCIDRSQQYNSDILGWGRKVHAYQPQEWHRVRNDWNNLFPYIKYDIQVKTNIKRAYLARRVIHFK